MRITTELLQHHVEQITNALGERELVLSGLGISVIENLSAAPNFNQFDCLNLNNNHLHILENIPKSLRLTNIMAANNQITTIQGTHLCKNLPHLQYLTLSHNQIRDFQQIANLDGMTKLEFLNLTGNPITRRSNYRLYTIHHLPTLKSLDLQKISEKERQQADRWSKSAAGAALERDLALSSAKNTSAGDTSGDNAVKTFTPGENLNENEETATTTSIHVFTKGEKIRIRELLENAKSAKEIEDIENCVKRGVLPEQLLLRDAGAAPPVSKRQKVV